MTNMQALALALALDRRLSWARRRRRFPEPCASQAERRHVSSHIHNRHTRTHTRTDTLTVTRTTPHRQRIPPGTQARCRADSASAFRPRRRKSWNSCATMYRDRFARCDNGAGEEGLGRTIVVDWTNEVLHTCARVPASRII